MFKNSSKKFSKLKVKFNSHCEDERSEDVAIQTKSTESPRAKASRLTKVGFTLAEVLITLVIIGVVAAITVPSVMNNIEKREILVSLRKAFSVLSQATDQIIMEEGPANEWAKTLDNIHDLYIKKLNVQKDCNSEGGCFPQLRYKRFNNTMSSSWNRPRDDMRSFILTDGTQIGISEFGDCLGEASTHGYGTNNFCSIINVDVNGVKGPNAVGYDLFTFAIKENGLYPAGCDVDYCNKDNHGYGCTCKVLNEGKISY